jgi:hypothetical protein
MRGESVRLYAKAKTLVEFGKLDCSFPLVAPCYEKYLAFLQDQLFFVNRSQDMTDELDRLGGVIVTTSPAKQFLLPFELTYNSISKSPNSSIPKNLCRQCNQRLNFLPLSARR